MHEGNIRTAQQQFWLFSLRQESANYLLPVPLAVYVGIFCGDLAGHRLIPFFAGLLLFCLPATLFVMLLADGAICPPPYASFMTKTPHRRT